MIRIPKRGVETENVIAFPNVADIRYRVSFRVGLPVAEEGGW